MPAALSRTHMPVLKEPSPYTGVTSTEKTWSSRRTWKEMASPWLLPIYRARAPLSGMSWPSA